MKKLNVKKVAKILAIFIIIMMTCLCNCVKAANTIEQTSSMITDITDENEVSTVIKDLVLTINSEGMTKTLLAETVNLYSQLTKTYTIWSTWREIEGDHSNTSVVVQSLTGCQSK